MADFAADLVSDFVGDFVGAKVALFCGGQVLTLLRDEVAGLSWAGWWDLPGGGREGDESAAACALRELREEFGLHLPEERFLFRHELASMTDPARKAWQFGGWITMDEVAAIRFGDEGQGWEMMPVGQFLAHERAIPEMRRRAGMAW